MICGGISIKGSTHALNQDWCKTYSDNTVTVIAVSDGVGSKPKSQIGAEIFCHVLIESAKSHSMQEIESALFLEEIQQCWQKSLPDAQVNQYCCTALFCIVKGNRVYLAQLGDGLAGITSEHGTTVLFDNKEDHFLNETDCLSGTIHTAAWRTFASPLYPGFGAVLCTDGVEIFPDTEALYKEFVEDITKNYRSKNQKEIQEEIFSWLSEWHGTDDKTIAFIICQERNDSIET